VSLADPYDAILLDLDGVLFRGDHVIERAPATVASLRGAGKGVLFLTNNSARTPEQVADKLTGLGIRAAAEEVVTSAHAAADLLGSHDPGATAYVIGQDGVRGALQEAGIRLVDGEADAATYVVVGWDGRVTYEDLRRATVLVRAGARLIATNDDASYPAPGGELWPGAGAILAAVETASGRRATVAGKPHRALFDTAVERVGTRNVLMVGDRIETDILGASDAGLDSVLVRSGASKVAELLDHDAVPVGVVPDVGALVEDGRRPARARAAGPEDLAAIRGLVEAPDDAPGWGPQGVWVIGDLEATATAEVQGSDAYLRAVATREDLRGTGLGTLAVQGAVRDAARRGAGRVWLFTERADGYFAGLGFEVVERAEVPVWIREGPAAGCATTSVPMRRALAQYGP
jgi:HAD superfamily hydrolase (TIGR01457 family)